MRVLHITNNYPTKEHPIFGIFVKEQIDSLSLLEVQNNVFFINSRENGKKEYVKSLFKLIKLLFKEKYDLIHCHHSYSAVICLLTGITLFKKKIISYQSSPDIEGGRFLFFIINLFFSRIILKAEFERYNSSKTYYLPNGCNMNFFNVIDRVTAKKNLGLNQERDYIAFFDSYVGRPYKRYDRYSEVINELRTKYNLANVEQLLLYNVDRDLVPQYINASKLHLLTSDVEGSPNSVKECLACNVAVVATPVGNVSDLLSGVEGCFVSSTFDAEELAKLAYNALKNERINGRSALQNKNLSIDKVAIKLLNLYMEVLKWKRV